MRQDLVTKQKIEFDNRILTIIVKDGLEAQLQEEIKKYNDASSRKGYSELVDTFVKRQNANQEKNKSMMECHRKVEIWTRFRLIAAEVERTIIDEVVASIDTTLDKVTKNIFEAPIEILAHLYKENKTDIKSARRSI